MRRLLFPYLRSAGRCKHSEWHNGIDFLPLQTYQQSLQVTIDFNNGATAARFDQIVFDASNYVYGRFGSTIDVKLLEIFKNTLAPSPLLSSLKFIDFYGNQRVGADSSRLKLYFGKITVSVRQSHLPDPSNKGDVLHLKIRGHHHPYRQDCHAPKNLLSQTPQSPGRSGMPTAWRIVGQRRSAPRHQCQSGAKVDTYLSKSSGAGLARLRSDET